MSMGKILAVGLLVVGVLLLIMRLIPVGMLANIPDGFSAIAVLIAGGVVAFAVAEKKA